ncbi:MAG TPA: TonB-dependent receptor [Anaeromyxobacteraceae bacterium]|nr:TonB-dependent receptor [Anaeromyxobacteraceae bacterium]
MTRTLCACAAVLLLAPVLALADDEPRRTVTLDEIVVQNPKAQSTDSTLGASEAGKADLEARQATTGDAAELLRGVPGVTLGGAGGISSLPSIHGLSDDRLRVQVDGIDLVPACPNHMNSTLSYADPTRVESVTVHAGITPVSVGGDSIGGSVQVKSAPPRFATPEQGVLLGGHLGSFFRSNGNALGYTLGVTGAGEWASLAFRQSDSRSENFRAGGAFKPAAPGTEGGAPIPGDVVGSSAYSGTIRRSLSLGLRAPGHLLQLEAGQQKVAFEGFPNQRMDMTWNDNWVFTVRYTGSFDWGDLETRLSWQETRHEMDMGPDRYTYGTGMPMDTEARTLGAAVQANVILNERHLLRVGAEAQSQQLFDFWPPVGGNMGPNTFWNVDAGLRTRVDGFAEWEATWSAAWLTQVGVRGDTVTTDAGPVQGYDDSLPAWGLDAARFNATPRRRTDWNWDLSALAKFTPGPTLTVSGGYARKTRTPNLYQRYPWSTNAMAALMNNLVGDGNGYVGLVDLAPEVAHTGSVTADWHDPARERWGLRATAYYTHVTDYIDARRCDFGQCSAENVTVTDAFVILQYANQSARLYGLDVSGQLVVGDPSTWGTLTGSVTAGLLRGDNLTTGDGLFGIMPANATAALAYQLGTWTTTAEVQGVAAKTHLSRVRNEIPTGAYALVNLRTSWEWRFLRLDGAIENLLGGLHANPQGGAYVGQGPSMSTTGIPWGVAVPLPGRSFNLAIAFRI